MRSSGGAVEARPRPIHERFASRLRTVTIRHAVWAGFIAVLALWVAAGVTVVRGIGELEQQTASALSRHNSREDQLSRIRQGVLIGGIFIRDAVFDSDAVTITFYRQQIAEARRNASDAMATYRGLADPGAEAAEISGLGEQLTEYWGTLEDLASEQPSRSAVAARLLLRRWVLPKRDEIIAISNRVRALGRTAFEAERTRQSRLYRALYQRSLLISGVAALVGLAVAALIARHAGHLERQLRAQMRRDAEATTMLHKLSATLVRAQEDERRTIARELHDEVGQALTAVKVELALARRDAPDNTPSARALDEARSIADRTLQTVRDLSQLLHPPILDDLGLVSAIDSSLRDFSRRTGVRAELLHEGFADRLPGEIEVAAYRIVQEGLTNAARHAHATQIRVYLQRLAATVVVTVEDDGVGFDTRTLAQKGEGRGMGLHGIEERVEGFGGRLRVESAPGHGTRLTIELPITGPPGPDASGEPAGA